MPKCCIKRSIGKNATNEQINTMCVRIWLEVGHVCEPRLRSPLGRALALDWRVWVRGAAGRDISRFVHKVVFYLHPASAFVYPKRVIQEPPYEIQESGCASIEIPIHVYLKSSNKPKKIRLKYNLRVENESQAKSESQCVYYDFENPPEQLWRSLMQGGGEVVARTELPPARSAELVLVGGGDSTPQRKSSSSAYEFVAPVHRQPTSRRTTDAIHHPCPLCGKSTLVDFNKHLSTVSMTKDEISRASHVYLSYKSYERSIDALVLPPLSDSIYKLPELPKSLKDSLQKDKLD